jgi:hypothetical protein
MIELADAGMELTPRRTPAAVPMTRYRPASAVCVRISAESTKAADLLRWLMAGGIPHIRPFRDAHHHLG